LWQGKFTEALEAVKKEKDTPLRLHSLSMIYHALGNTQAANKSLQELIDKHKESYSFQIASTYAYYQDKDKMFYWLEKALFYKDFGLIECNVEPLYDFCRDDPRRNIFMNKIGFIPKK
jgi:tetratricopeptide (TPR) repeat protein